jgi:hypothetical protein
MSDLTPNLEEALRDLARQLTGAGWRTKPEVDWTPDEHRAYHRWATMERARQEQDSAARGEKLTVSFVPTTHEECEHERRTAIGAFLRPHRFTLCFSDHNQTMEQYGPDYEHSRTYPGVDLERV